MGKECEDCEECKVHKVSEMGEVLKIKGRWYGVDVNFQT